MDLGWYLDTLKVNSSVHRSRTSWQRDSKGNGKPMGTVIPPDDFDRILLAIQPHRTINGYHHINNSYYGGNRIINMIINPFGYRTCRQLWCTDGHMGERGVGV